MPKYGYREIADLGSRCSRCSRGCWIRARFQARAPAFTVFGRLDVLAAATSGAPHYFFSHRSRPHRGWDRGRARIKRWVGYGISRQTAGNAAGPRPYDSIALKMSVWRFSGGPHPPAPLAMRLEGTDTRHSELCKPKTGFQLPLRYARTMEDVDDKEEAELERLILGVPAGNPASPSPFSSGASAPRLDAPSSLPTATIDLTFDGSPPLNLPMVRGATSGHVQATLVQEPPPTPALHTPPRRQPMRQPPVHTTAWKATGWPC